MKKEYYQKVFAALFFFIIIFLAVYSLVREGDSIASDMAAIGKVETVEELQSLSGKMDTILAENTVGRQQGNELYSWVQQSLNKREESNFTCVKDKNNFLYNGNFWNTSEVEAVNLALRLRKLQDKLDGTGTKLVCLMYPTKYSEQWTEGYYGIPYNNMNAFGDSVLRYLRRYNVDYIDYREVFLEENRSLEDTFYKTEYYWTVPTAFDATGVLVDYLRDSYGDDLDPTEYYTDIRNYAVENYEDAYLGEQGRETGMAFAEELDDFAYVYPKFDVNYHYSYNWQEDKEESKEGTTLETLIDSEYLSEEDIYERKLSRVYLKELCQSDRIENRDLQDGKKLLFIRDAFSSPLAVFMAPMCKEIDLYRSRYCDEKLLDKLLSEKTYDYVFVALTIDNFTDKEIPFYGEEVTEELKLHEQGPTVRPQKEW